MKPAAQLLRLRSATALGSAAKRSISTNRGERTTSTASAQRERTQGVSETDKFLHFSAEDGYYKTSPFDPVVVPNVPLHEYVWRDFKKWERRTAAVSATKVISGVFEIIPSSGSRSFLQRSL